MSILTFCKEEVEGLSTGASCVLFFLELEHGYVRLVSPLLVVADSTRISGNARWVCALCMLGPWVRGCDSQQKMKSVHTNAKINAVLLFSVGLLLLHA